MSVRITNVTFGSLSCLSCLCIAAKYYIMWEKRVQRKTGKENILCMASETATMQASSDLETRCSEISEIGALPLLKESNFFAILCNVCGAACIHRLHEERQKTEKPLCISEFRIP